VESRVKPPEWLSLLGRSGATIGPGPARRLVEMPRLAARAPCRRRGSDDLPPVAAALTPQRPLECLDEAFLDGHGHEVYALRASKGSGTLPLRRASAGPVRATRRVPCAPSSEAEQSIIEPANCVLRSDAADRVAPEEPAPHRPAAVPTAGPAEGACRRTGRASCWRRSSSPSASAVRANSTLDHRSIGRALCWTCRPM